MWLLFPGHQDFVPSAQHWEKLIEVGRVWLDLNYESASYPAIFVRKHDTDEEEQSGPEVPSTSAEAKKGEESDTDPFTGRALKRNNFNLKF